MIIKGSRYKESVDVKDDEVINVANPVGFLMTRYMVIRAKEGDSFESLASQYLQSPYLYWKIADCNKQVKYPDYLEAGSNVRIPLT